MTGQREAFDLHSLDLAEARREELLPLFPEINTEGGKLDLKYSHKHSVRSAGGRLKSADRNVRCGRAKLERGRLFSG
jgi:hypothetical protein